MTDGPLSVAPVRPDSAERAEARAVQGQVDTRDAPGALDTIVAGFTTARADTTGQAEASQVDAYKPVIEALLELQPDATFARYISPSTGTVNPQSVWRDVQRYRGQGRFTELPATLEEFETQWRAKKRQEIEAAEEVAARGNGIAAFAGGVAGAMTDPVNLLTLPVGGVGKTVLQRVLTEALVNAGVEAVMQPGVQRQREQLGRRDLTPEEAGLNIVMAGVGAAALRGGIELAPAAGRAINDTLIQPAIRKIDPDWDDKQLAKAFADMVPRELRTPEQEAALFVMQRTAEVEDASPYVRTHEAMDAHVAKMEAALRALEEGRVPKPEEIANAGSLIPPPSPVARPVSGGFDRDSVKAAIRGPESAGDDMAVNRAGSPASGRYQFMPETFVGLYKREYGVSEAAARQAWQQNRFDVAVQERLMDRLLDDNAAALTRAGFEPDPGNLYLAHFAGAGKAVELLRASPDAPVSAFFSAKAIRQNSTYLGGKGKTVGEAIDIIRGKVGDAGQRSPAPIDPRLLEPELRNPALDAERPVTALVDEKAIDNALPEPAQLLIDPLRDIITGTRTSLNRTADLAAELGTDEATLRTALQSLVERGDITQNKATGAFMRKAAAPNTAANTKRPRTLVEWIAENGGANDFGGELRAAGIRVNDKRFGKKIIRAIERQETTGGPSGEGDYGLDTLFRDAREAGYFPELDGRLENTYDDLVDGSALLLQAINEELGGSPRYRMDDWDRLPEYKLTGSTEGIYGGRLAALNDEDIGDPIAQLVDSFRAAWEEFGLDPAALAEFDGDFLFRAADFYDRGDAFLPEHALAMVATEDYERALAAAIREGLADEYSTFDPWNPEWDAEFERRFQAARARDRADGNPLAGSEGVSVDEAIGGARSEQPQGGGPSVRPSPAELDAAAAAKPRSDHSDLPPPPDPRFDEPDGPGIASAADSAWHDIDAALKGAPATDPNIAARQAQEAQLGAQAPMRARVDQDGEMGLGLFDAVDQKSLFDLGDGRGERTVGDIRAEIDADRAAIEEIKKCLI